MILQEQKHYGDKLNVEQVKDAIPSQIFQRPLPWSEKNQQVSAITSEKQSACCSNYDDEKYFNFRRVQIAA